jgi:DNA-binding SARP family transcriptional activator/tetratricopeptide (TPR) repeat protein
MIALRALGKAEIVTPTDKLTPSQEIVFAAALYLFLERAKAVKRTDLADALWPGIADSARQHRLRQTLLELKRAGIPLEANRETVSLPANSRESDLDVLFIHGAGDIDSVESLQFLPGYTPAFSRVFSDWLDLKRSEVSTASSRLLINDIRRARSRGNWLRVERLAKKCMDIDPFNEEAVLARAEASAMRGAKREAVTILDRYVTELGPGSGDLKLPANLMRKRIAERVPEAAFAGRTEGIFVGRESDMQLLTTVLDDARAARGRCCLVWGDAGIGKSRLAAELGKFGELQGVQVRRVACRRGDSQRPLSVFVEAVPMLREMRGALGCSPDTMADLQRLTQFDIGSSAKQALEMDPQSIFELIRLAIFDLIDAVSEEQCLMLVVEDVQWLDPASARILGQIADWATKKQLLLIFTSRLRENPLLDACTRAGLVAHHLQPLSKEAATALVSEMFDATNEKRDDEFLAWCRTVGDGNPFFLHELVKQWLETKQRHVIPPSITSVIRDRFSRLSSEGTQLLQACSILGENSTLPRVEKMLQQEPYMLLGALNELSKASMLSAERKQAGTSSDFRLAPRHDLVSMVALKELDPHAEIFLHRRAGEVLEAELGAETQDTALLWACAQHWQKAGETHRGYLLAKSYALHLAEVGLPVDAADALIRLRQFCQTKEEELEVLDLSLQPLQLAHRWSQIKQVVEEIKSMTPGPSPHDEYELLIFLASWRSSVDPSTTLENAMMCLYDDGATARHRVHVAAFAMKVASDLGDAERMDAIFSAVNPLLDQPGVDDIARWELLTVFHSSRGKIDQVIDSANRLAEVARRTKNAFIVSDHLSNCATALRLVGQHTDAAKLLTEGLELAVAKRSYLRAKHLSTQLARQALMEGDPRGARKHLDRFVQYQFPPEDTIYGMEHACLNARIFLEEGRIEEAQNEFAPLITNKRTIPIGFRGLVIATAVRLAIARKTSNEELESLVTELEEIHLQERAAGWNDFEAHSLFLGLSALGNEKRGIRLLSEYLREYRRDTSRPPEEMTRLCQGTLRLRARVRG